jgi:tripartite-type tricarboxylate transporter receptor subunit TctC
MTINLREAIVGLVTSLVFCASTAFAQSYPDRPIRLILPYNPGGIVDYVGRALGQHLGEALGQPVVPENRAGAGGILGTEVTARAQPDGYTLLLMDPGIVINPSLQEHVPYDLFKQLDAISVVSSSPLLLVVTPALNVKTLDAFIAYAKANPGKLNFATAGVGTAPHLAAELFKQHTGIEATHVPYKGIGASYIDLMSNKIQFSFSSIAGAIGFTKDNRVLALASTGERRSELYPDTPTMIEAGLDFTVDLWLGLFAPANMPDDVKAKLTKAVQSVAAKPAFKAQLATIGATPRGTPPAEAAVFVKAEYAKWKQVIVEGKIRID